MDATNYKLNAEETNLYNSDDDRDIAELYRQLKAKFGRVCGDEYDESTRTAVYHPDGFLIDVFVKTN